MLNGDYRDAYQGRGQDSSGKEGVEEVLPIFLSFLCSHLEKGDDCHFWSL